MALRWGFVGSRFALACLLLSLNGSVRAQDPAGDRPPPTEVAPASAAEVASQAPPSTSEVAPAPPPPVVVSPSVVSPPSPLVAAEPHSLARPVEHESHRCLLRAVCI